MKKNTPSPELERIEGISLKVIDYQEHDQILSVFTKDWGVKQFIAKGAKRPRSCNRNAAPLMRAEFLYLKKKRGDLLICKEISVINSHLFLRLNYEKLDAACTMAKILYHSQLPCSPAPLLFLLFQRYLEELEHNRSLTNLLLSFQLKCLKHEGFFTLPARCSVCFAHLAEQMSYQEGQFYCSKHSSPHAHMFRAHEIQMIAILTLSRNFDQISAVVLSREQVVRLQTMIDDCMQMFLHVPVELA